MQLRGPRFSFHLEPAGRVQVLLLPDAARVRKFLLPGAGGAEEVQQTHVNQHPNNGPAEKDLSHPDKRSRKDGPHGQASFSVPWQPASTEGGGGGWGRVESSHHCTSSQAVNADTLRPFVSAQGAAEPDLLSHSPTAALSCCFDSLN